MAAELLTAPVQGGAADVALAALEADLAFIFDEAGVHSSAQAKLGSRGYMCCRVLARAADTPAVLQTLLRDGVARGPAAERVTLTRQRTTGHTCCVGAPCCAALLPLRMLVPDRV